MEETFYCKRNINIEETQGDDSVDRAVCQFREIMKQKKEIACQKKVTGLLCIISMVLLILSVTISIATMNSYERMKQMETALQSISDGMEQSLKVSSENEIEENKMVEADTKMETETMRDPIDETVDIAEAVSIESYIVQKGDTLDQISKMFYQSSDMVDEICSINNIEDKNIILCGQELILP